MFININYRIGLNKGCIFSFQIKQKKCKYKKLQFLFNLVVVAKSTAKVKKQIFTFIFFPLISLNKYEVDFLNNINLILIFDKSLPS